MKRAQQLLLAALELPKQERRAWLSEQCGEDTDLMRDVCSLLDQDSKPDDPREAGVGPILQEINVDHLADTAAFDNALGTNPLPSDSNRFLTRLSRVGLISDSELEALLKELESGKLPSNAQDLASGMVASGKLTSFQAKALLRGKPNLLVDNYLILDLINAGGMGMVFKAIHRPMNRVVAVKMIAQQHLYSPEQVRRFQREVRVAATLEHPNIVRSYDADQVSGIHFLVMEYVRGRSLSEVVQQTGPMSVELAVHCISQAARGLQYAHRKGIIHRDIKPGNVMLTPDGTVKVLDLGLAHVNSSVPALFSTAADHDVSLTAPGTVLGTAAFIAPEQSVDAKESGPAADVYSLGCTLFYLLTGEPPYQGKTLVDYLVKHRDAEIPSLRDVRPDVPVQLDAICQRMLAKAPEDRFESMSSLLKAIDECRIAKPGGKKREQAGTSPATNEPSPLADKDAVDPPIISTGLQAGSGESPAQRQTTRRISRKAMIAMGIVAASVCAAVIVPDLLRRSTTVAKNPIRTSLPRDPGDHVQVDRDILETLQREPSEPETLDESSEYTTDTVEAAPMIEAASGKEQPSETTETGDSSSDSVQPSFAELEAEFRTAVTADQLRATASSALLASVKANELAGDRASSRALAILAIQAARKSGDTELTNQATLQYLGVRDAE